MTNTVPPSTTQLIIRLLSEEFRIGPGSVRLDALMSDLLDDSLMVVEMAVTLQDQLGVKLQETDLRNLTLDEFIAHVDALRATA